MDGLTALLDEAAAARRAGDGESAERLGRRAVADYPDAPQSTIALAAALEVQGRREEAAAVLDGALARSPEDAELNFQSARLMIEADRQRVRDGDVFAPYRYAFPWGDFPFPIRESYPVPTRGRAEALLRECLAAVPDHGAANALLGLLLLADDATVAEAAERIQAGVAQAPDQARSHAAMGCLALRAGQFPVAAAAAARAAELGGDPTEAVRHCLAAALSDAGGAPWADDMTLDQMIAGADGLELVLRNPGLDAAVRERAVAIGCDLAGRLIDRAVAAVHEDGALVGGARALDAAMRICPDHADAAVAVGALMLAIGQFEAAEVNLINAPKLGSTHRLRVHLMTLAQLSLGREAPAATALDYRRLALIACRQQDFPAAETWLRRAIDAEPGDTGARIDLATVLSVMGRTAEAVDAADAALALRPDDPEVRMGAVAPYMAAGDPGRVWPLYESRLEVFRASTPHPPPPLPRWDGQALDGKRLLIWHEEGIGDEVIFASFLLDFRARWPGGEVVFECAPRLAGLFRRSLSGITVRAAPGSAGPSVDADFQLPLGSLMLHVRPTMADYEGTGPFLVADPDLVAKFRERLAALGPGLKVGLAWRSMNMSWAKRPLQASLVEVSPLLDLDGVQFVNLQCDLTPAEVGRMGGALHHFDDVDLKNDLEAAAALIAALDRVIAMRGWVATFAGLTGTETLCCSAPPATYSLGADRVPWAPAIHVFSKAYGVSWEAPLKAVAAELREAAGDV
ncbi:MAG: tetratricopeptide repeat protein [Rhodospirillaceae bacterium]